MDVFVERNLDMGMANEYFNECRNPETGKCEKENGFSYKRLYRVLNILMNTPIL